ncbi:Flp family type IVb pilin [Janibacter sp. G1551]
MEYALMAGLIALAIVLAVTALGTTLVGIFQDAADGFP